MMRTFCLPLLAGFFLSLIWPCRADTALFFTPYDNVEAKWVGLIDSAHSRVEISCFGLSNPAIETSLERALKRGVKVLICEDKRQSLLRSDLHALLSKAGAVVVIKPKIVLEHDKMMTVDGQSAVIGSWNLSRSASAQDNSAVVMTNEPAFAQQIEAAILRIAKRDDPKVIWAGP